MNRSPRRHLSIAALVLLAGIAGCGGEKLTLPGDATPTKIEKITGDNQAGIVGTALPQPLVAKVTDELGRPVANQSVAFTIVDGGGQVSAATVQTGDSGRASITWTLGPNAGDQHVQAQVTGPGIPDNLVLTFKATAIAGSGSLIAAVSGDDQTAPVNSALADSLIIRVSDASNNPVQGITIQWTAVGGGSVSPETVVTGSDGRAAAARVLGPTAGQQSAQATGDGLAGSPVTFVHTAVASNPTTLTEVSGNNQSAPAGFQVAESLVVRLTDADGNGVGGRAIAWVISTGGGTVNPASATTDPNGLAVTYWTLGPTAGANTLTAVFSGLAPVPFTANASPDVPATIALQSGNNQSAAGGQALANPLVVKVTDGNNNPVQSVPVVWTAQVGGTVDGAATTTVATNAQGLAQVTRTLGTAIGAYTTTAAVDGLSGSPVTFNSTATVGAASKIVIVTQPSATAVNGVVFAQQPVVQVQDAAGNNVGPAGRLISAVLVNAEGDLNGTRNRQTNATGQATYTNLNITGPVGTYTMRFSSGILDDAFSDPIVLSVGAPSAAQSTVDAAPTSIAVGETSTITVTVRDAGGNPVAGVDVDLDTGGNGNTFTPPSSTSDANGQITSDFSSTVLGNHTITATLNGGQTVADNAVVSVSAGAPSASQSTVVSSQASLTAGTGGPGTSSNITVTARDAGNNPIAGAMVELSASGTNNSLTLTGTTGANGQFTTTFSSTTAEVKTITAKINGVDITDDATVTVVAGDAATLSFSQQPANAANGATMAAVGVTALDAFGNLADANVHLALDVAGDADGVLSGDVDVATVGGVATFSDLSVTQTVNTNNDAYTLTASASGASSATSSPFHIN
jgi:adhesin/invasin